MDEKTEYFKIMASAVLNSGLEFNSEFDDSLEDSDLRVSKTTFIDESDDEFIDEDFKELEHEIEWDIECLTAHLGDSTPKWESIIKYPTYTSGSKMRIERNRIQREIENLNKKMQKIEDLKKLKETSEKLPEIAALSNDPEAQVRIYEQLDHVLDELTRLGYEWDFDDDCEPSINNDYEDIEEGRMTEEEYELLDEIQGNLSVTFYHAMRDKCAECEDVDYFLYTKDQFNFYRNTIQICNCGARMDREQIDPDKAKKHLKDFNKESQETLKTALQL